jgi:serine/threonine protein kinase/predicted Zn-dependent protease
MPPGTATLGNFIEAFEAAVARDGHADLARFLPPPGHPLRHDVLRELVRIDLEHGWLRGQPTPVDHYRQQFPELFEDSEAVREVLFEDYRLRLQVAEGAAPQTTVRPATGAFRPAAHIEVSAPGIALLPGEQRAGQGAPSTGTVFEGFRLIYELGRGAFGRVFLAEQLGLAGRPVVLKVARELGAESQTLARLQHTHIVPVYSAHGGPELQAVCMPCLGTVTLADLLAQMRLAGRRLDHGWELLALAGQARAAKGLPEGLPEPPPAPQAGHPLHDGSFVQAVLWLGARLAEGLAHAHERGILHRDLKPANILLADDGTPLLLDFSLAEDARERRSAAGARVGGTLPYMAPEQIEAFQGKAIALDGRSDVFALGCVLFELLTGRLPWPVPAGPLDKVVEGLLAARRRGAPDPGLYHSDLTPAERAILCRCLEPDPNRRYKSARALLEDLDLHLRHLPLAHASEPSLTEQLGKWSRRHPRGLPGAALVLALLLVVAVGWLAVQGNWKVARFEASASARRFHEQAPEAQLLCLLASPADPVHLAACEQRCEQLLEPQLADLAPDADARRLQLLPAQERANLRREVGHLLLLWAHVRTLRASTLAGRAQRVEALRSALELNRQAEACFDTQRQSVLAQRAELLELLGEPEQAARLRARPVPSSGPRDLAGLATRKRRAGDAAGALALIDRALGETPDDFWLWFDRGLCQEQQGDDRAAAASFSTCLALTPSAWPARLRRSLAHLRQGDHRHAAVDLDEVVRLQPAWAEARINRALARAGLGEARSAVEDLDAVIQAGAPYTRVYFLRAQLRDRLGDHGRAQADRAEGLRRRPGDALSWVARAHARLDTDPTAALADLDRALALEPDCRPALQNRAYLLAERLARPADAVVALDRLLARSPDDAVLRASRGVLLARLGRRLDALADARACLARPVTPEVAYQLAGLFALTAQSPPDHVGLCDALFHLETALRQGYGSALIERDPDLHPLRSEPRFLALCARFGVPPGLPAPHSEKDGR